MHYIDSYFNIHRITDRNNKGISVLEKIIYLERKEAIYYATGHKIKAWYYRVLLRWYRRYE